MTRIARCLVARLDTLSQSELVRAYPTVKGEATPLGLRGD